jgi:hypothetical protein
MAMIQKSVFCPKLLCFLGLRSDQSWKLAFVASQL